MKQPRGAAMASCCSGAFSGNSSTKAIVGNRRGCNGGSGCSPKDKADKAREGPAAAGPNPPDIMTVNIRCWAMLMDSIFCMNVLASRSTGEVSKLTQLAEEPAG